MQKKLLLLLALVFSPSSCYSESIAPYYGYTGNAVADQALKWSMGDILPDNPGLDIQNVLYNYRIQKETGDLVTVTVSNENPNGGYIFREVDEWRPGSLAGTEISKVIGVGDIPRAAWGDGSIDVNGPGSVYDANVIYTYKVTPCFDPQYDPNCPNYKIPVPVMPDIDYEIYDAVAEGDSDQAEWEPNEEYDEEETLTEEELAELEAEEDEDRKERLEEALFEAGRAALFAQALVATQQTDLIALAVNMNSYYEANIPGGEYKDSVQLSDTQLPDAKSGLRNGLAQQLLHQKMVQMQYEK